jgi:phospholipid transport system transporter-binding protein
VIKEVNNDTVLLTGNLVLTELSKKNYPDIASYQNVRKIDLQQLENIDSAGIAYLAQVKTHYPDLSFVEISDKIHVLAKLYGLNFLFKS